MWCYWEHPWRTQFGTWKNTLRTQWEPKKKLCPHISLREKDESSCMFNHFIECSIPKTGCRHFWPELRPLQKDCALTLCTFWACSTLFTCSKPTWSRSQTCLGLATRILIWQLGRQGKGNAALLIYHYTYCQHLRPLADFNVFLCRCLWDVDKP